MFDATRNTEAPVGSQMICLTFVLRRAAVTTATIAAILGMLAVLFALSLLFTMIVG